mgnify:CR=1
MSFKSFLKTTAKGLYSISRDAVGVIKGGYRVLHALPVVGGIIDDTEHVAKGFLGSYLSGHVGKFLNN